MRRKIALGSNAAMFTVLVLGIVVVVNLVLFNHHKRFDMTEKGAHTLSPQTEKTLGSLKESVSIYAFVDSGHRQAASDLLELYDYESDKLSVNIIDPDKKPALARKYDIKTYNTYVVETASGRKEVIDELTEEKLTNAIIKATTSKVERVYVLEGHGERSLDDDQPLGWSGAKKALESAGYKVETLNWFTTGGIPEDAGLLIIPGPRNDFQPEEIERLRERLDNGGSTMVTLDPGALPNLEGLLARYGFVLRDDMILDPLSQQLGFDPLVATVAKYEDHPVVKGFRAATFFPVARSVELKKAGDGKIEPKAIGKTAPQSWSETDMSSIEKGSPTFDDKTDVPGPRIIAASAQWEAGPPPEKRKIGEKAARTRLIVAGDSDFASNSTLGFSGNKDLYMNMVAWLLEQENMVSIRPKTSGFNPIIFTKSQLLTMFWVAVVAVPAVVAIFGVIVVIVRRRA